MLRFIANYIDQHVQRQVAEHVASSIDRVVDNQVREYIDDNCDLDFILKEATAYVDWSDHIEYHDLASHLDVHTTELANELAEKLHVKIEIE